jgi:type I restriction enzyme S subunit
MPKTMIAHKSTWTKVAFGDVVQLSRERSSDPETDGHERFVGLEHIDPADLRLRRWGNVADGVTFTSVFRPGQVLFGKRRAYQRKVAVADFSGVCSGDIYVLEPKGSALLPELLPFICQTEAFFEHAVGTSAGSLSPRTNWESLASFEFTLPPIEEQLRIVSLLQAIDRSNEALVTLDVCHANVARALVPMRAVDRVGRVSDFAERVSKGTTPRHLGKSYVTSGIPFLRGEDLQNAEVMPGSVTHCIDSETDLLLSRSRLRPGDVLVSIAGTIGRIGLVRCDAPAMNCNQAVAFIRPRDAAHSAFLFHWLQTGVVQDLIRQQTVTGTIPNLSLEMVKSLPVPLWGDAERTGFTQSCEEHASRTAQICRRREMLRAIKAHASSSALGGAK